MQNRTLATLEHGVQYLRNCVVQDPTDFGTPQGDVYVYQVGNLRGELAAWNRPEDVKVCVAHLLSLSCIAAPHARADLARCAPALCEHHHQLSAGLSALLTSTRRALQRH